MAFNPDIYLQSEKEISPVQLKKAGFDPNAYLEGKQEFKGSGIPVSPGERIMPPSEETPRTMMDYVRALGEVPYSIVKSVALTPISIAKNPNEPLKYVQENAYQPTSPVTQDVLQGIGSALETAKVPPYVGGILNPAMATLPSTKAMLQLGVQGVKEAPVVNKMAQALRKAPEPTMSGVGSAVVPEAVTRQEMAQQLRVPIKLSKGEATRELGQQQFEAETMKTYPEDVGRPLIMAKELRNAQIGQNLDAYVEATGAKVANEFYLRPTGEAVDSALRESATKARKAYKTAYDAARNSEEGQQIVNVKHITDQLNNMEAEALNAPVINSAKMKLEKLAPNGEITLNNLEEVRKMVGELSQDTPTQMKFGGDIKKMIDATTENAGGDLFKQARKLRTKFANEFENVGLIDDLLSTKSNSKDRVVALENVFNHSVMQSDLDSLMSLGKALKKTEKGQQAWKELQGQTIENLRAAITKNIETDSLGQRTFSPKQFDVLVKNLDKSGKLDYLFGKSGAQEIRNLRDTVININSPVKGINTSNTASAMDKVLNKLTQKAVGKVPFAGSIIEGGAEMLEKRNIAKKVQESINYSPEEMAKQLRKGK